MQSKAGQPVGGSVDGCLDVHFNVHSCASVRILKSDFELGQNIEEQDSCAFISAIFLCVGGSASCQFCVANNSRRETMEIGKTSVPAVYCC